MVEMTHSSQGRNWSDDDEDDWNFEDHMRAHGHEVAPTAEEITSLQLSQAIPDSFDELTTAHPRTEVKSTTADKRPEFAVETEATQILSPLPEEPADLGGLDELPPSEWGLELGHQGPQMSIDFWWYVHFKVVANFAWQQKQRRQKNYVPPAYPELSTCDKGQDRINYCSNWRDLKVVSSGGRFHHSYQYKKSGLRQELRLDDDEVVEIEKTQGQEAMSIEGLDLVRFEFSDSPTDSEDSCSTKATSPALSENGEDADVEEVEFSAEEPEVYIEKGIGFPLSIEHMSLLHSTLKVVGVALSNEDFLELDLVKKIKDVDFPGLDFDSVCSSPPPLHLDTDTLEDVKENIDDSPIRIAGLSVSHKDATNTTEYTFGTPLANEERTNIGDEVDVAGMKSSDSLHEIVMDRPTPETTNDTAQDRSNDDSQVPSLIIENDFSPTKQALDDTSSTEDDITSTRSLKHKASANIDKPEKTKDAGNVADTGSTNPNSLSNISKTTTSPSDKIDKTETTDQEHDTGFVDATPPHPTSDHWPRIKPAHPIPKLPATNRVLHTVGLNAATTFAKQELKPNYKPTKDPSIITIDSGIDEQDFKDTLEAFEATYRLPEPSHTGLGLPSSSSNPTLLATTALFGWYSHSSAAWKAAGFVGAAAAFSGIYYAHRRF